MCVHYNIKVTGKVQGVWFRKYTKGKADELGLLGTVENQPDGSVYIEVESNDAKELQSFIDWLYQGSPLSKVSQVILDEDDSCKDFTQFDINR